VSDLLFVILTLVFFGLAVGLVRGCDRVIGPDELDVDDGAASGAADGAAPAPPAAPTAETVSR